jgi:hypothetical protein
VLADGFLLSYVTREEIVHNCRLSCGRRMVERASGILASQFEIFVTTINLPPAKVTTLTLTACTLHNL